MIVYNIEDVEGWNKIKDHIKTEPVRFKTGYFLPLGLEELWPELDWSGLVQIELTENDLIKDEL